MVPRFFKPHGTPWLALTPSRGRALMPRARRGSPSRRRAGGNKRLNGTPWLAPSDRGPRNKRGPGEGGKGADGWREASLGRGEGRCERPPSDGPKRRRREAHLASGMQQAYSTYALHACCTPPCNSGGKKPTWPLGQGNSHPWTAHQLLSHDWCILGMPKGHEEGAIPGGNQTLDSISESVTFNTLRTGHERGAPRPFLVRGWGGLGGGGGGEP